MSKQFEWSDNIINSRDIIDLLSEIKYEYDTLVDAMETCVLNLSNYHADIIDGKITHDQNVLNILESEKQEIRDDIHEFMNSEDKIMMDKLSQIDFELRDINGYHRGIELINSTYFTEYVKSTFDGEDGVVIPNHWPWNHVKIDWDAAANEIKPEYVTVDVDKYTFYVKD